MRMSSDDAACCPASCSNITINVADIITAFHDIALTDYNINRTVCVDQFLVCR